MLEKFKQIPIAVLAIALGAISTVFWISTNGTLPLVISILAGSTIAIRAALGDEED